MTAATALAWEPNGLPCGVTLSDFDGFCLSPVCETEGDGVSVCRPQEATFWSVYGFHEEAQEWQIVHDADARDMGEALARIAEITLHRIEYRDPDRAYANTSLPALCALIAQRLADEQAAPDHPLAVVRSGIAAALEARGA